MLFLISFFLPYHLLCFFLICGFRYWRKPQILQELFNIGGVYLCHIALCNIELVERQFLAVLVLEGIALKLRVLKHVIPQIEDNLADKLVCRYHAVLCLAKEIAEFLVLRISGFIHAVVDSREKLAESEEDLLEHRTDGADAFETLYIGCEKFPTGGHITCGC